MLHKIMIIYDSFQTDNAKQRLASKHFTLAKHFCASVAYKFNAVEREIKKNFMAENLNFCSLV